jgi:hypothetical protein
MRCFSHMILSKASSYFWNHALKIASVGTRPFRSWRPVRLINIVLSAKFDSGAKRRERGVARLLLLLFPVCKGKRGEVRLIHHRWRTLLRLSLGQWPIMFMETASKVKEKNLTYLGDDKLESMSSCISSIKMNGVPGDFVEFGIALGGSGICIATELDNGRRFIGFDVFGMIPPPSNKDGPGPNERYEAIRPI